MAASTDPLTAQRLHRLTKVTLAILLALFGLWIIGTFIPCLIWAAVITIAIDPLYQRAEDRWPRARRALLPAIATFLIALLVLAPLALGLIEAAREAGAILQWLAQVRENGMPEPAWLQSLPLSAEISRWWQDNLATPEAARHFQHFRGSMLLEHSQLWGKGLIHRMVIFAFTLIALFFLLRDRDVLVRQGEVAARRLLGYSGKRIGIQLVRSVRGTIDGLVLVGIGEGAVMAVVYILLGVPHPLLLGFLTAIAAMIPFGAALLFGVAAILLIGQGSVGGAVAVVVIGLVVVAIADHFLRPILIGGSTRMPFLWVLIGILGGVETLGLLGLFVGPATMATLIMLWRDYVGERLTDEPGRSASPAGPPPPDYG